MSLTIPELQKVLAELKMIVVDYNFSKLSFEKFTSIENTVSDGISYLQSKTNLRVPINSLCGTIFIDSELATQVPNLNSETKFVVVEDPKYLFAYVYSKFSRQQSQSELERYSASKHKSVHPSVEIAPSARIHRDAVIGMNSVISDGVSIHGSVFIGDNVHIKDNTVIGGSGFGYATRKGYPPLRVPHLGGVNIGNNVDIGSCTTIDRGTFSSTMISDDVKIDNGVHIAHNARIGKRTLVIAHAEVSGSVEIGEDCWIAPKVSIRQKVRIGNNVIVGIGSVVLKDIESNMVVAGVPARPI